MDKKPRRRFRFGLRTLLIVVTLCGCWLGWQTHRIRQRRELWGMWESASTRPTMYARLVAVRTLAPTTKQLPWWRKALGDRLYEGPLILLNTTPAVEIERLAGAFPEAGIEVVEPIPTPGKDRINR
jgi:hypothetical protein